jgi:hypothetical protein
MSVFIGDYRLVLKKLPQPPEADSEGAVGGLFNIEVSCLRL